MERERAQTIFAGIVADVAVAITWWSTSDIATAYVEKKNNCSRCHNHTTLQEQHLTNV